MKFHSFIHSFIELHSLHKIKIDFYTNGLLFNNIKKIPLPSSDIGITVTVNMPQTYAAITQYDQILTILKNDTEHYISNIALTLFTLYPFEDLEYYFKNLCNHTHLRRIVINVNKLETDNQWIHWFQMLKHIAILCKRFHFILDGEVFLPLKNAAATVSKGGLCTAYHQDYICIGPQGDFLLCAYYPKTFRTLKALKEEKSRLLDKFHTECGHCPLHTSCIGKCILDNGLECRLKLAIAGYKRDIL